MLNTCQDPWADKSGLKHNFKLYKGCSDLASGEGSSFLWGGSSEGALPFMIMPQSSKAGA